MLMKPQSSNADHTSVTHNFLHYKSKGRWEEVEDFQTVINCNYMDLFPIVFFGCRMCIIYLFTPEYLQEQRAVGGRSREFSKRNDKFDTSWMNLFLLRPHHCSDEVYYDN